jgi:hypothetical protein
MEEEKASFERGFSQVVKHRHSSKRLLQAKEKRTVVQTPACYQQGPVSPVLRLRWLSVMTSSSVTQLH